MILLGWGSIGISISQGPKLDPEVVGHLTNKEATLRPKKRKPRFPITKITHNKDTITSRYTRVLPRKGASKNTCGDAAKKEPTTQGKRNIGRRRINRKPLENTAT